MDITYKSYQERPKAGVIYWNNSVNFVHTSHYTRLSRNEFVMEQYGEGPSQSLQHAASRVL